MCPGVSEACPFVNDSLARAAFGLVASTALADRAAGAVMAGLSYVCMHVPESTSVQRTPVDIVSII